MSCVLHVQRCARVDGDGCSGYGGGYRSSNGENIAPRARTLRSIRLPGHVCVHGGDFLRTPRPATPTSAPSSTAAGASFHWSILATTTSEEGKTLTLYDACTRAEGTPRHGTRCTSAHLDERHAVVSARRTASHRAIPASVLPALFFPSHVRVGCVSVWWQYPARSYARAVRGSRSRGDTTSPNSGSQEDCALPELRRQASAREASWY
ncbi:hypothetical protein C8R45DRAFT_561407 [Mycena sanguinolenta]|nr:hypothetical protein C8R45DRAFT_561407 [Mycena sanguinolenta]